MSDQDLDLYSGGELAPYNPGVPLQELQPIQPDNWGNTDVDEYQRPAGGRTLFGEATDASPQQVQAALGQIGGIFLSDFSTLGFPAHLINSAIQFFMDNATKPPQQVQRHHQFNLKNETGDWLAESFGNHLHSLNGTQAQKQQFLDAALLWLKKLEKHLGSQQGPTAMDGPTPTADPTDQLSDEQYAQVVKINDAAKAQTYAYLENLWGKSFAVNLRMVDKYLASLPRHEQLALDTWTTGWVRSLNTKEVILFLYQQAIGAGNLPSGGALSTEIAQCEHVMKYDRRSWNNDERLQARYRQLITLRDGG